MLRMMIGMMVIVAVTGCSSTVTRTVSGTINYSDVIEANRLIVDEDGNVSLIYDNGVPGEAIFSVN